MSLSTAAKPSPFDPLDRMPATEGRFVIRETDPAGPGAITEWGRIRRNIAFRKFGTSPAEGSDEARLLKAELDQCNDADDMALEWKERQDAAEPVENEVTYYSGATLTEEQVQAAKRQKHVAELVRHLREAAYFACELIEQDGPSVDPDLAEQHAQINAIANAIEYGGGEKAEAA